MRDIYRAKLKSSGEWIYWDAFGSLVTARGKRHSFKRETSHGFSLFYNIEQIRQHVLMGTVGRYTGLRDKNSAMIFEGDILSAYFDDLFPQNETRETVVWHDFGFCRCYKGRIFSPLEDVDGRDFAVIGNIYDNPELLEVSG